MFESVDRWTHDQADAGLTLAFGSGELINVDAIIFYNTAGDVVTLKTALLTVIIMQFTFLLWSFENDESILKNQKLIFSYDAYSEQCLVL